MSEPASIRRWFQFSLRELLVLSSLLGMIWWGMLSWTTTIDVNPGQLVETPIGFVSFPTAAIVVRGPLPREIAWRCISSSVALIGSWLVAREMIERRRRRQIMPESPARRSWFQYTLRDLFLAVSLPALGIGGMVTVIMWDSQSPLGSIELAFWIWYGGGALIGTGLLAPFQKKTVGAVLGFAAALPTIWLIDYLS